VARSPTIRPKKQIEKVYEQFYQEELVKARRRNVEGINNTSLISGKDVVIS
jgi:hypothetical protein